MKVLWCERTLSIDMVEQRPEWITEGERELLLGQQKGRLEARLVAKQLLAEHAVAVEHLGQIHIESRDGRDRSTRPRAYVRGSWIPWNLAISHTQNVVSAVVAPARYGNVGVDLVDLDSLKVGALDYWFTQTEKRRGSDPLSVGIIWSLKEAVYKATNEGTPFFPGQMDTTQLLPLHEWRRVESDMRDRGEATAMMNDELDLSLSVADSTIRAIVWHRTPKSAVCEVAR